MAISLASPRTPPEIANVLWSEVSTASSSPEIKARFESLGIVPQTSTRAEFASFYQNELTRWGAIVKQTGLRLD